MTARNPPGYRCHIDTDLAHTALVIDLRTATGLLTPDKLTPQPCNRRHRPIPTGSTPGPGLRPRTRTRLLPDPLVKPPKAPAPPPRARRSPPKRATLRRPGTPYGAGEREAALELVAAMGIAAAHRALGIPKGTLSDWAKAAGLDLGEQARAQTRSAAGAVEAKAASVRVTTVDRLERILEDQLATLEAIGKLERRAAELALSPDGGRHIIRVEQSSRGREVTLDDDTAAGALALVERVCASIVKRDVVGAATRAVHDLQLLKGDATERGTLVVRFGIPRPSASDSDRDAVDEINLNSLPGAAP